MSGLIIPGCCEGIEPVTPERIFNRPGLDKLRYRIGNQGTFFETMLAHLTTLCEGSPVACRTGDLPRLLRDKLTTRSPADPAIAMLDACAMVLDVLTFYQERIANEGYLRTANERRSLYELARLVGYQPRPGVASSVHLAFEVEPQPTVSTATGLTGLQPDEPDLDAEILIPAGTQVKSTPTPGTDEQPQTFETSHDFLARPGWNQLEPKISGYPVITRETAIEISEFHFEGIGLRLQPNAWLALVLDPQQNAIIYQIKSIDEDLDRQTTKVVLRGNDLAVPELLSKLEGIVITFLSHDALGILTSEFYADLGAKLLQFVARAKIEQRQLRLPGIDKKFDDLICGEFLTSADSGAVLDLLGGDKTLRKIFAELSIWAKLVQDDFGSTGSKVSTRGITLNHKNAHTRLSSEVRERQFSLYAPGGTPDGFIVRLNAQSRRSGKILEAKRYFWDGLFHSGGYRPVVILSPDGPKVGSSTAAQPVAPDAAADLQIGSSFSKLFLAYQIIAGPTTASGHKEILNLAGGQVDKDDIERVLRDLSLQFAVDEPHWLLLEIRHPKSLDPLSPDHNIPGDMDHHLLGTTLQQANLPASSVLIFPELENEKSVPHRVNENVGFGTVDSGMILFSSPSTTATGKFWAKIELLGSKSASDELKLPEESLTEYEIDDAGASGGVWILQPDTNAIRSQAQFQKALQKLEFKFGDESESRTLQYRLFTQNPGNFAETAKGASLRVIARHKQDLSELRKRVGDLIGQLTASTAPDINTVVDSFKTDTGLESLPSTPAWDSVRQQLADMVAACKVDERITKVISDVQIIRNSLGSQTLPTTLSRMVEDFPYKKLDYALRNNLLDLIEAGANSATLPLSGEVALQEISTAVVKFRVEIVKAMSQLKIAYVDPSSKPDLNTLAEGFGQRIYGPFPGGQTLDQTIELYILTFTELEFALINFAGALLHPLYESRSAFVDRIVDIREARDLPFDDPVPSDTAVKERLEKLLVTDHGNAFAERILTVSEALKAANNDPADPQTASEALKSAVCSPKFRLLGSGSERGFVNDIQIELNKDQSGTLADLLKGPLSDAGKNGLRKILAEWSQFVDSLTKSLSDFPATFQGLPANVSSIVNSILASGSAPTNGQVHDLTQLLLATSDLIPQIAAALAPNVRATLFDLLRNVRNTPSNLHQPQIFVFRNEANVFGWNAPEVLAATVDAERVRNKIDDGLGLNNAERARLKKNLENLELNASLTDATANGGEPETKTHIFLDGEFKNTGIGSVIAIDRSNLDPKPYFVRDIEWHPRVAYGISGTTSHIELNDEWWRGTDERFDVLRDLRVLCDAEKLTLAEYPMPAQLIIGQHLILDDFVPGLSSGKTIIMTGAERMSQSRTSATRTERLEIASVRHSIDELVYGDKLRTVITLAESHNRKYWRDSVRILANIVEATHGESQNEILGAGDATKSFQKFKLKKPPLTWVSALTQKGTQSTLTVSADNVKWEQQERLFGSKPEDRHYTTITAANGETTAIFGDGENGARLPSGVENVRATYRSGIGSAGNVKASQIDQLAGPPLGVKGVINPLAAEGGADPDDDSVLREQMPASLMAQDRLVSASDYADFAMAFAGIGKATSSMLQGRVQLTVAGINSRPLSADGPILTNLRGSLRRFADPLQQFVLHNRELLLLVIRARVAIDPAWQWRDVEPKIREALFNRFDYQAAQLWQEPPDQRCHHSDPVH